MQRLHHLRGSKIARAPRAKILPNATTPQPSRTQEGVLRQNARAETCEMQQLHCLRAHKKASRAKIRVPIHSQRNKSTAFAPARRRLAPRSSCRYMPHDSKARQDSPADTLKMQQLHCCAFTRRRLAPRYSYRYTANATAPRPWRTQEGASRQDTSLIQTREPRTADRRIGQLECVLVCGTVQWQAILV